jgi:hypothetical protein
MRQVALAQGDLTRQPNERVAYGVLGEPRHSGWILLMSNGTPRTPWAKRRHSQCAQREELSEQLERLVESPNLNPALSLLDI